MIVYFEDNGQDFLWWKLKKKNGYSEVVECGPFQAEIWEGTIVANAQNIVKGSELQCLTPLGPTVLLHKVERIEAGEEAQHA